MTAPDHLRITGPEDILGFIPHSLGYWPENSLVAMTLQGKRLGATLRVDLPVPGGGSGRSDMLAGFARNVVAYLQADDAADGSLLAFFTDTDADADTETDSAGDGHAWADLLKELELALEAAGLPLRDAWIIGTEFWRNAHCSDPDCCGMPGRPVEQIRNSRLNAEMVYRGSSVGAVPGAQGTTPAPLPVDPAVSLAECGWAEQFSPRRRDRAQFDQVLDVWTIAMHAAIGRERLPVPAPGDVARGAVPGAGTTDAGTTFSGTTGSGTPDAGTDAGTTGSGTPDPWTIGRPLQLSPELAGYLRASLCIPSWRDAVLVMAAAGRSAAERGAEDFGIFDPDPGSAAFPANTPASRPRPTPSPLPGPMSGPASRSRSAPRMPLPVAPGSGGSAAGTVPAAGAVPGYGEVLLGLAPSVPDWTLMVGLERVLERLGRLGDGEATAAAVTARGWIEWCRGRGSYADALYRQALQGHPGYRLAELLAELGRRGTLCGWAARREAAWQKFAPDAA
ncbi:DUF4192 family protein [Arthrobacter humicola]